MGFLESFEGLRRVGLGEFFGDWDFVVLEFLIY
jgi:hypothetical protein